jgi:alpha-glucosidase
MYSIFKLYLYLILGILFGPVATVWFKFYGDFYSLSKTFPIFDVITEEWLLLLSFFIFWNGFYFLFSFYYELQKYLNRPPSLSWWQTDVLYQIYIKSFYDSNNDGYGDLQGITKKLDYLNHMGIKSIWLTPFYPSGGKDGGYDITNYKDIDPIYGTMKNFDQLVAKVHEKGMHIILDLVVNHTSDQHEWFKKSVANTDKYRDYYVWVESEDRVNPPNNWLSVFGGPAWTYNEQRKAWYLHQFLKEQPDLNFRCPAVLAEIKSVLNFWLEAKGVDGFRVDAFKHFFVSEGLENEPALLGGSVSDYDSLEHLFTTGQPETFELLKEWREMFDEISKKTNSDKALIVECTYKKAKEIAPYYKHSNKATAHFPFNFQLTSIDVKRGIEFTAREIERRVQEYVSILSRDYWPNWQLGNHDVGRVASRVGKENVNMANALNLLLGGTSIVYYGEEIGMENLPTKSLSFEESRDEFGKKYGPNDFATVSRDFFRTPMQWDSTGANAGFTQHQQPWLPVHPDKQTRNVQVILFLNLSFEND